MVERFEQMEQYKQITEAQLEAVKKELDSLKSNLADFPKKTWYRTAGHTVISLIGRALRTQEGRELATTIAKGLLTHDPHA
jgi:hypothetical protein